MATYTTVVRYNDAGTATNATLTITSNSVAEAYVKDGDTYRLADDSGIQYVVPETSLIYMSFEESE